MALEPPTWSQRLLAARAAPTPEAYRSLALEALGDGWEVAVELDAREPVRREPGERLVVLSPLAFEPTLEATRRRLLGLPDPDALRRLLREATVRPARAASALRVLEAALAWL